MVEKMKKALGGWSIGKDINVGTMLTLMFLGFAALWTTKDKYDTIGSNQIKLAEVEIGYRVADSGIMAKNQTEFVEIGAAVAILETESQQRALILEKIVVTQGFVLEALDDISERLD